MEKLQPLDYVTLIVYMLIMAGIGIFFGWFVKDIKGYYQGGNVIPWLVGAISNYMGLFSAFVFVAYAGIAYESGIVGVVILWSAVVPCVIAAIFLAKRWRRAGIITPVEYLEKRFSSTVRQTFSWIGLGMRFLDNMVRLYAIGIFIAAATDFTFLEAVLISGAIVTLFTVFGGIWAVVVMDNIQFVILIFATLLLVPLSLEAVGGLQNLMRAQPAHFDFFNGPKGQPLWLLVYYILVTLKYNANWVFIQRFYSVRNEASSRKLGFFTALLFFIFPVFFLLPAIAATVILPGLSDPETAYVAVAVKLLPAGLLGLMMAAIFSGTMSSLNAEFNVMSGVMTNDVYKRLFKPDGSDQHLVWVARLNLVLVGAVTTGGSFFIGQLGGAFEANKLLAGIFAIPLAIPLVFGIVSRKPRPIGAMLTIILGVVMGLVLNLQPGVSWEVATLIEIIVCVFIFFSSGWWASKSSEYKARVEAFFRQVNTPLQAAEIPSISASFRRMLLNVFAVALVSSGGLILVMSLLSMETKGGQIALYGAFSYFLLAIVLYIIKRKSVAELNE